MVDACRIHPIIQELQTMMKSLKALAVAAVMSMTAMAPMAVQAGDQHMIDEVLVILSSESLQTQGMAMVLSNTMAQKGAKVNVLLCDKAGDLALKTYDSPALKSKDVTPGQMLNSEMRTFTF
ncbi:MAG: hypothetical protein ACI912_001512 [Marinobacter psychrophilus]|jgi:hypothetical protein